MAGYEPHEPADGNSAARPTGPSASAGESSSAEPRRHRAKPKQKSATHPRLPGPQGEPQTAHACDPAFQHGVVVGFDGSLSSERALAYAVGMARRSRCGLVIVHVANRLPATVWAGCEPPVFVDVPDHRTEVLGLELACADYLADVPWVLVERGGDICHELEEVGREYAADAIVVGSTHGLIGKVFGSVSGRLARRANRPVVVIP
ncbi:universal stress protein [Peterkaempfera bronchialis]|uniref:universal stress protein n=1 Tax=Peterkaempfera bronchialis TaxID=2126346 RepID=UPI003C2CCDAC